jgi:hypothetical protein
MLNFKRDNKINFTVPIPKGEDGLTGRECPNTECLGYFKMQFGTGLKGENLQCHCPYCGHIGPHNTFFTPEQIEYAKSVALNQITGTLLKDLKKLEFDSRPVGGFGLSVSMKISGEPHRIYNYREKQLETEVVCEHCTLRYAVYGVFAFCPDCGQHNSSQILDKSLELVLKMLDMAATTEAEVAGRLVENALEDCVSVFDGFGLESCRVYPDRSGNSDKAERISFQNLEGAKQNISGLFNYDLAAGVTGEEWLTAVRGFQKRHLLSHKMGVVDDDYIRKSGDKQSVIGRKVVVGADEVREIVGIISKLARSISTALKKRDKDSSEELSN